MMKKILNTRVALSVLALTVGFVLPSEATPVVADRAAGAGQYLDEFVIGALIVGVFVLLDEASWSWMTNKR